jgi:hypothetical protein
LKDEYTEVKGRLDKEATAEMSVGDAGAPEGSSQRRPPKRRTGRPRNTDKDSATKVVAALSKYHGYGEGMSVTNREPATNRGLAAEYDLSANALTRFLTAKLGKNGHRQYAAACRNGRIGALLALWRGETPERLLNLLPNESGSDDE